MFTWVRCEAIYTTLPQPTRFLAPGPEEWCVGRPEFNAPQTSSSGLEDDDWWLSASLCAQVVPTCTPHASGAMQA
ncbi:hypothetical protein AALO_G00027990 [Alosa alosa]|uniref:Uncharacterized protein n=1 Tax=Alosa alosa TaxID=278164 RepID=A0AAV6HGB6_9TELE|nr:hypothetical protein AALO_G00027990 [Alosa alosa]